MVRLLDSVWNHFIPSLYLMQRKLQSFGLVMINDEVVYIGDKDTYDV
jgi:hypothetical protein